MRNGGKQVKENAVRVIREEMFSELMHSLERIVNANFKCFQAFGVLST